MKGPLCPLRKQSPTKGAHAQAHIYDMQPKRKQQQCMERFAPLRKLFVVILLSALSVHAYLALNDFYGGTIGNKAV